MISVVFPNREDIDKMVRLDREVFADVCDEVEQDTFVFESWYDKNRFQWLVAKDPEDNVLGYISLYHMKLTSFEKILNGQMSEIEMSIIDIEEFKSGNEVCCYIDGFVVKDKNSRVAIALLNKFLWYFRFLKENNITVKKIGATVVTNSGLKLVQKLGFKKVNTGNVLSNGKIPEIFSLGFEELMYSRLMSEVKDIILKNNEFLA